MLDMRLSALEVGRGKDNGPGWLNPGSRSGEPAPTSHNGSTFERRGEVFLDEANVRGGSVMGWEGSVSGREGSMREREGSVSGREGSMRERRQHEGKGREGSVRGGEGKAV